MSYHLIIRKRAENHLVEAYNWYEKQKPALGSEFLLRVEASLAAIETNPLLFQPRHKQIRCALTPRFPYGIFLDI
jgi:toxin ParE1/3/4